jgi:hypothetical protein
MSARTIISHRLFVAALNHHTNGTGTSRPPSRVLNPVAAHIEADRGSRPEFRTLSPRAVAARQILSAAITSGF